MKMHETQIAYIRALQNGQPYTFPKRAYLNHWVTSTGAEIAQSGNRYFEGCTQGIAANRWLSIRNQFEVTCDFEQMPEQEMRFQDHTIVEARDFFKRFATKHTLGKHLLKGKKLQVVSKKFASVMDNLKAPSLGGFLDSEKWTDGEKEDLMKEFMKPLLLKTGDFLICWIPFQQAVIGKGGDSTVGDNLEYLSRQGVDYDDAGLFTFFGDKRCNVEIVRWPHTLVVLSKGELIHYQEAFEYQALKETPPVSHVPASTAAQANPLYNGSSFMVIEKPTESEAEKHGFDDMGSIFIQTIFRFIMAKKYAQIETCEYDKSDPSKDKKTAIKERKALGIDIEYIDCSWFRNIVRTEGFKVRGHFRLQPYKNADKKWTRKLIYIKDFEKKGYSRKAKILNPQ